MNGIDCASSITKEIAEQLKRDGFSFVCRYLVPEGYSKRLTADEAKIISDAGLKILCVFETYAERAKEGAEAGRTDGALALQCAQELNIPTSAILYFAVDFDAQSGDMDAIEEYLMTAKANIGKYDIGVYGGFDVVSEMGQRGVCKGHWQTYAWSGGAISNFMNVYQYQNDEAYAGINVDFNEAESLVGMWNYMEDSMTKDEAKKIVQQAAGLSDATIQYIADDYRWGDEAIVKLAKAIKGGA